MANKEATIYIIDINPPMWVKNETTKLSGYDYAKKIISELLHIKVIFLLWLKMFIIILCYK